MLAVEVSSFIVAAPLSFVAGLLVGWGIASKYRIAKVEPRNGKG